MIDQVLSALESLIGSPMIYGALALMSFVDSVLPLFPSEAPIILTAAYSASAGTPNIVGIFFAAAIGAWLGDHVTYFIGRTQAARIDHWPDTTRRGRAVRTAKALLAKRGGMALVVARFIPWGRIATTFVMGATRYPLRSYSAYDALGTSVWALHGCLLGYLGGIAFKDEPLKGMILGLAMAVAVSVFIELGRWWWERRHSQPEADQDTQSLPTREVQSDHP
ncbi:DedA family protein [Demetria terragena]|uniref:DedA family protein n=1 Tax=Demetria terragena TaxID=63959 RepID=UPI000363D6DC|nr:DedA family protein [Demetria terragena]